jgi:hypothetical protein
MTRSVLSSLALFVLTFTGCFNPAAVQKMQQANWSYSMSPSFSMDRTWRIAVLPAVADGEGYGILPDHAGLLLMKPGRFLLVDRGEVGRVLREQRFSYSGPVDPGTAARLGRLMGAEGVLVVNVSSVKHDDFFSDNPKQRDAQLYVKIISVGTGEVLYYAQGHGSSFEGAEDALKGALDTALGPLILKGSER